MDQEEIIRYIAETFTGVEVERPTDGPGAGDTFFIYNPQRDLEPQRRFPFATIVAKDYGDFDNASQLNRPGIFRLNIGLSRETIHALFGPPGEAESDELATPDFAALDRLMPHPVYARQAWVCVLNPRSATFELLKPLLAEAYSIAATRHDNRQAPPR